MLRGSQGSVGEPGNGLYLRWYGCCGSGYNRDLLLPVARMLPSCLIGQLIRCGGVGKVGSRAVSRTWRS